MADEAKVKKETIGDAAVAAIRGGKTNQEALEAVKAKFPEAKTTLSSINWYRNKLRSDGEAVKSARELKAAQPKAEKPAPEKAAPEADPLA